VSDTLDETPFDDPASRAAVTALAESATFGAALTRAEAEDAKVADLLRQAAVIEAPDDAGGVVARLVDGAGKRALRWLDEEAGRSTDPARLKELSEQMGWLKLRLEQLYGEPAARSAAVGQLVPFLRQRATEAM